MVALLVEYLAEWLVGWLVVHLVDLRESKWAVGLVVLKADKMDFLLVADLVVWRVVLMVDYLVA